MLCRWSMRHVRIGSVVVMSVWILVVWQQFQALPKQSSLLLSTPVDISPVHATVTTSRTSSFTQTSATDNNTENNNNMDSTAIMTTTAGYLNGIPVVHYNHGPLPRSQITCTHPPLQQEQPNNHNHAWMYQSCHLENLCFDTNQQDFVLIRPLRLDKNDPYQTCWNHPPHDNNNTDHSNTNPCAMALGGINPRWDQGDNDDTTKGSWKVQWFPRILRSDNNTGYYQLPSHVVWSPFHSMAGHNVGHLVWDDLYPLFRLWRRFQFVDDNNNKIVPLSSTRHQILLWRQKLTPFALYATCDIRRNKRKQCKRNFQTFVSLVGIDPHTFSTNKDYTWNQTTTTTSHHLICARTGVAGIGLLTDHGMADHGWDILNNNHQKTYPPHNLGHARDWYAFGDYVLANANLMRLPSRSNRQQHDVYQIVFSLESSKDWDRRLNFTHHVDALRRQPDATATRLASTTKRTIDIQTHRLWQLPLSEQLQLAVTTDIFVTVCGGGSMTATFLPRGATLIVFYNPAGGYDYAHQQKRPDRAARLDWDLLNFAASHLRVHWFPIRPYMLTDNGTTMTTRNDEMDLDLEVFVELIRHELDVLESL